MIKMHLLMDLLQLRSNLSKDNNKVMSGSSEVAQAGFKQPDKQDIITHSCLKQN